jgi:hypothetical protein
MYLPGKATERQTADAGAPAVLLRQHRVTGYAISETVDAVLPGGRQGSHPKQYDIHAPAPVS